MAKKLEEFKKEFQTLENKALEHVRTLTQFETSNNNARAFIAEGADELARSVQKIKDTGFKGKELKDFLGDSGVKKAVAEIDSMANRREAELGKMHQLKPKAVAVIQASAKLTTEMRNEIASRKKQLTTKLGIGNKSLPGMIAELEKLAKARDDKGAFSELQDMLNDLDQPGEWKTKRDDAINDALAKTKDAAISDNQRALMKQALDLRHLTTVHARSRKLFGDFAAAAKLAKEAKKGNKAAELKKAKADAVTAAKNLVVTVEPLEKAIKDPFISKRVKDSSSGSKITQLVGEMISMRDTAAKEVKVVAAL